MRRTGMDFKEYGYQDMRKDSGPAAKKKSKYVAQIMRASAKKEREQDIIWQKRKLKEMEAEGSLDGVERFVTSGYAQKLKEDKQWVDEDQRKTRLEDDVTAHEDVTGSFYQNLYRGTFSGKPKTKKREPVAATVSSAEFQPKLSEKPVNPHDMRAAAPELKDVPLPKPSEKPVNPNDMQAVAPELKDVPLPKPSEKVNPNDMQAVALQAYLRDQELKRQERGKVVIKKPKPKPVKVTERDIDAMRARYFARKKKREAEANKKREAEANKS